MPKYNTYPAASTIDDGDLLLKDEADGSRTEKLTAAQLAEYIANKLPPVPEVDSDLEVPGAAADAKKTGDGISDLGNELKETNNKIVDIVTESGVGDYTVYHVQSQLYALAAGWNQYGSSVASRGYVVFPVNPGDDVIITGNGLNNSTYAVFSSYTPPSVGDAVPYSSATGFNANTSVDKNSFREFTVPDDGAYLYMHLGTAATDRTPAHVFINNYDILRTTRENIFRFSTPTKFRLMQYNIGKYSGGNAENPGLPAGNYDEKLTNYRKMLCKYHPDVIGIEEFIEYIDAAQTHKADDVLFDYPYPYSVWYEEKQRSIKSKCPILYAETGDISATGTTKYATYAYAKINFNGRIVSVLSTANISGTFDQDMADRAALLPEIVNKMRNDEYAFIAIDANNAGNSRGSDTVRSREEYEIMRQTLEELGWKTCNGGYLPLETTTVGGENLSVRIALDNIFYKDNGKIIFDDFVVLSDEYGNLASDHIPVYADFTLL